MNQQLDKQLFIAGNVIVLLGAAGWIVEPNIFSYIYSVGVAILIFVQIRNSFRTKDADRRHKRLIANAMFATLVLAIGAYFMFKGSMSWVPAVIIYAITTLFLSYRGNPEKKA